MTATIGNDDPSQTPPFATAARDHDVYTRYEYDDGLQTKLWVDLDGDDNEDSDDQVTQYIYGTTKGTAGSGTPVQSAIGTGHLLREVVYPPQSGGQSAADRTVTYAYNAQGEQVWMKGQEGNVTETDLDTAGRETHQRVTTLATGFDGAVRRISTTYLTRGMVDNRNFDVLYTLDALNRLQRAEEGTLTFPGGTPTLSNRSRDERWLDSSGNLALSQTGNWLNRRLDLDGNGVFTGTGELDETNTFSLANELKARDTDSNGTDNFTFGYDKVGNETDDGEDYTYVYDPWGRVRQVKNRSNSNLVAEYRYNGLGFKTGWHYDANTSGAVDGSDPWYWFCYDEDWRMVATFRDTDSNPKEVFVHHNAGLGGHGGSSYIDSVLLRDRDASTVWTSAADSNREERRYYAQNWRSDVSAILTSDGKMVEWEKYSAYGVPFALPAGDTDSDGDFDPNDAAAILFSGGYDVRQDAELDGDVDTADATYANSITGGYQTLGRGLLSSTAVNNRRGYAGYEYDPTFEGAGRHLYHVRHRVYDADIGRWTRRDPLGYVDGTSLYEYVRSRAITTIDPMGQASASCASSCGGVPDPCAAERLNWLAAKAALASALSWLAGCFLVPPPGNFICAAAAGSAAIAADFAQRSACISLQACEMANAGTVFTFCDNGGVWPPGFTPPPPPPPYKRDPEWPTYPGPGGQCRI